MARVFRCGDDKKVWYRQSEMSTKLEGMKRFQNDDEEVLTDHGQTSYKTEQALRQGSCDG